uniref:Uncharacterized protein n=1 Tax=Enterobacter asburiae TaxID=61645 RepID=A0A1Z1E045_ENTAS|nr:hypothetical protein [Enterobacter asburiae]
MLKLVLCVSKVYFFGYKNQWNECRLWSGHGDRLSLRCMEKKPPGEGGKTTSRKTGYALQYNVQKYHDRLCWQLTGYDGMAGVQNNTYHSVHDGGGENRDQILAIHITTFYLCNRLNRTGFQGD